MYKKALQQNFRFRTLKGTLTTEQLFQLSRQELDDLYIQLSDEKAKSEKKGLMDTINEESDISLKIDIVFNIFKDKTEKLRETQEEHKRKLEKEKLLNILEKKQNESLENLSEEEIKERLKNL